MGIVHLGTENSFSPEELASCNSVELNQFTTTTSQLPRSPLREFRRHRFSSPPFIVVQRLRLPLEHVPTTIAASFIPLEHSDASIVIECAGCLYRDQSAQRSFSSWPPATSDSPSTRGRLPTLMQSLRRRSAPTKRIRNVPTSPPPGDRTAPSKPGSNLPAWLPRSTRSALARPSASPRISFARRKCTRRRKTICPAASACCART